jgi:hypothetical protein
MTSHPEALSFLGDADASPDDADLLGVDMVFDSLRPPR